MITCICDKHVAVIRNIDTQRIFEFAFFRSLSAEFKLTSTGTVDNDDSVVDTIHQINISIGTYGDITGLVGFWLNIEKKFADHTIFSVADV